MATFKFYSKSKRGFLLPMKLSAAYIRAAVTEWLRYEKGMYLIAWERGLGGRRTPDVLAVGKNRMLHEVEIKISWSDYLKDFEKRNRAYSPHYLYYAAPPELAARIAAHPHHPPGAGVLTFVEGRPSIAGFKRVVSIKPCALRRNGAPITMRQMAHMARNQAGTLVSLARAHHLAKCGSIGCDEHFEDGDGI